MRAVEAADADVDDARREAAAVVLRDRNPAERDLGEVALADADGGRASHAPEYKHRHTQGASICLVGYRSFSA
jgi:hypothetical protein